MQFKSRFVRTHAFVDESNALLSEKTNFNGVNEMPILHRGVGTNTRIWRNFLHLTCMFGRGLVPKRNPSNTCVIPFNKGRSLLSAHEGGLPFIMDARTLETNGESDFDGALRDFLFLAHTRYDADTNRLVGLGVKQRATTHLVHIELDADTLEVKVREEHEFSRMFYVHDFALTPSSLVLLPVPMALDFKVLPAVIFGEPLW